MLKKAAPNGAAFFYVYFALQNQLADCCPMQPA